MTRGEGAGPGFGGGSHVALWGRLESSAHAWAVQASAPGAPPDAASRIAWEAGVLRGEVQAALGSGPREVLDALGLIEANRFAPLRSVADHVATLHRALASAARGASAAPPNFVSQPPPLLTSPPDANVGAPPQTRRLEGAWAAASPNPGTLALGARGPEGLGRPGALPPSVSPSPGAGMLGTLVVAKRPQAPSAPPPRQAVSLPPESDRRGGLPDSMARPAPPKLIGDGLLGLRDRGGHHRPNEREEGPLARSVRPSEGGGAPLLGLAQRGGQNVRTGPRTPPYAAPSGPRPPSDPRMISPYASSAPPPQQRPSHGSRPVVAKGPKKASAPLWFWVAAGALGLLVVALAALVLIPARDKPLPPVAAAPVDAGAPKAAADGTEGAAPAAPAEVHKVAEGGVETKELKALLDTQATLVAQCRGHEDSAGCSRWSIYAKDTLTPVDAGAVPHVQLGGPLPPLLQSLRKPRDFPALKDDPALRGTFDFRTKNIAGRQTFQAQMFNCAAYGDIFDATLAKYGAPLWLKAVVFQESGCDIHALSPTGARGLWQFMPEAARGYGLRVEEDVIDERLNPAKATEAAIHFLTDLQRKFGAWDLALAAYNMGPYGVAARRAQAGGDAGFWDLAAAELLPDETAGYVPSIEALALILENLNRLQFSRDGKRLQSTAEIVVKPGTRLSLLARAARTSTDRILELNPEFLGKVIPQVNGVITARVPETEYATARAFLDNRAAGDDRDECVPSDFDWGVKPFETSRYAKSCDKLGGP